MKSFNDNSGASWNLGITLGTARRVYAETGVDLLNPAAKADDGLPVSQRLLYDDLFFVNVICAALKPQLVERNVAADEFCERLDGETLQKIETIFWEEMRVFFAARGKDWVVKALDLDLKAKAEGAKKALEEIDALSNGTTSLESPDAPESPTTNG